MTAISATKASGGVRFQQTILRQWPALLALVLGVWVFTPFLAPVFMKFGWVGPANVVYGAYSVQCHQLPQRSYFFFGERMTYSLEEINAARGSDNMNPLFLRQFVGNEEMGYKVAWSDRMISLYTSFFMGAVVFAFFRRRLRMLPAALLVAVLAPIALDGGTHMISDLWGIGSGFRDTNDWLRAITGNAFADAFYRGDTWGSFNAWMRLLTGVLAGFGLAWFFLPLFDRWLPER